MPISDYSNGEGPLSGLINQINDEAAMRDRARAEHVHTLEKMGVAFVVANMLQHWIESRRARVSQYATQGARPSAAEGLAAQAWQQLEAAHDSATFEAATRAIYDLIWRDHENNWHMAPYLSELVLKLRTVATEMVYKDTDHHIAFCLGQAKKVLDRYAPPPSIKATGIRDAYNALSDVESLIVSRDEAVNVALSAMGAASDGPSFQHVASHLYKLIRDDAGRHFAMAPRIPQLRQQLIAHGARIVQREPACAEQINWCLNAISVLSGDPGAIDIAAPPSVVATANGPD